MVNPSVDYECMAVRIESHVNNYQAPGHREPIRVFFSGVYVNAQLAQDLKRGHQDGTLMDVLNAQQSAYWQWPCIQQGVLDFFRKNPEME